MPVADALGRALFALDGANVVEHGVEEVEGAESNPQAQGEVGGHPTEVVAIVGAYDLHAVAPAGSLEDNLVKGVVHAEPARSPGRGHEEDEFLVGVATLSRRLSMVPAVSTMGTHSLPEV